MTKPCRAAFIIDVCKKHRFWCFSFVTLFNLQGTRPSASAAERTLSYHVVLPLSSTFFNFFEVFSALASAFRRSLRQPIKYIRAPRVCQVLFYFVEIFFALSLARPPRFRQLAYYTRPLPFCQHFFPSFCCFFIFLSPAHQPAAFIFTFCHSIAGIIRSMSPSKRLFLRLKVQAKLQRLLTLHINPSYLLVGVYSPDNLRISC